MRDDLFACGKRQAKRVFSLREQAFLRLARRKPSEKRPAFALQVRQYAKTLPSVRQRLPLRLQATILLAHAYRPCKAAPRSSLSNANSKKHFSHTCFERVCFRKPPKHDRRKQRLQTATFANNSRRLKRHYLQNIYNILLIRQAITKTDRIFL